jgi:hypothetical protein
MNALALIGQVYLLVGIAKAAEVGLSELWKGTRPRYVIPVACAISLVGWLPLYVWFGLIEPLVRK